MPLSEIVGIDLGTTFSAVARINEHGAPELVPNEAGDRTTPSVVFYDEGEFIVGEYARENAVAEPEQVVEFVKREMGKPVADFWREFGEKQYSAEEISAEILKALKRDAEDRIGGGISGAVITVPAYFNDPERQATLRAGELAGLEVHRIVNEPTAAALAYGMHRSGETSRVLVFDLGGGTFDVTVMEIAGQEMNILATNGDHRLGGKDWDDKIILHAAERFEAEHGENPLHDLAAYQDLQARAVQAKIQLSTLSQAMIVVSHAGRSLRLQLTRADFEAMTADLVERCRSLVEVVLEEAALRREEIDTVLLVGGSTRLPMIRAMLAQHFGKPPDSSVNPDEAVAMGAAVLGALIRSEQTGQRRFIGAGPESGSGMMRISDVCSHSLGMVALDEKGQLRNSTIIPKNTRIPCEVSRDDYETTAQEQTEFDLIVLQGDMQDPRDCPVRDAWEIYEIPPRPAGETRLKVAYRYDANGVIEVNAEDVLSGRMLPKRRKEGEIDWNGLVSAPMDIALLIDCSWSMDMSQKPGRNYAGSNKFRDAKKAAIRFLDEISFDSGARVGLVRFGGSPLVAIEVELTRYRDQLRRKINAMNLGSYTPMAQAIGLARRGMLVDHDRERVIVLLTDGMPTAPGPAGTLDQAGIAKNEGVRLIAIGVGNDVDQKFLRQIASTPEDYYFAAESVQLESTFSGIAGRLVAESSRRGGLTKL